MNVFEKRILDKLKYLDLLHERLQSETTGTSPHAPQPEWVKQKQRENPFYPEVFKS